MSTRHPHEISDSLICTRIDRLEILHAKFERASDRDDDAAPKRPELSRCTTVAVPNKATVLDQGHPWLSATGNDRVGRSGRRNVRSS